ncbi:hypothetical protein VNO77_15823 [Canavalia gladiata]|uniref:Late embryogenesis abundant protein LEA-2 subgroup domain-containing protein n=1 Tax=Canavalia gladiata TaxID=3824 RepID=A0AAN9QSJ3_CANGL
MTTTKLSITIFTIVIGLTTLSLLATFLWFALKPRFPTFHIDAVTVTSLSTTASAELNALFNVVITIRNPNRKVTLSYENLDAAIWFERRNLALAFFQPFSQGTKSKTELRTWFQVFHKQFKNNMVRRIGMQLAHGSVDFGLTLNARVRFRSNHKHSAIHSLNIECYPIHIVFPLNDSNNHTGTLAVPSDCDTVDVVL